MQKAVPVTPEEQHFTLANSPPGPAQKRFALVVGLCLLAIFVLITAGPLSGVRTGRIDAFIPIYLTGMFVNDSITAVLLFAQFSIQRSRALLVIANGYLFTAFMLIPYLLTFPGVFAPRGLIGGLQSTSWLYFFQYAVFPMFVIAYALLKDAEDSKRLWRGAASTAIVLSAAATMAVVLAASSHAASLKSLVLRSNEIRDRGAAALAASRCLAGLATLDLSGNAIGESGARALTARFGGRVRL